MTGQAIPQPTPLPHNDLHRYIEAILHIGERDDVYISVPKEWADLVCLSLQEALKDTELLNWADANVGEIYNHAPPVVIVDRKFETMGTGSTLREALAVAKNRPAKAHS